MFMVIFGAGASYDSVASRRPSEYGRQQLVDRPPLATELFLPGNVFAECLHYFPESYPIIPYLQAAENLEHTLATLQEEAETDTARRRQITSIRYYLQLVISQCENRWQNVAHGITNYVTLLDQLRRCRKPEDPVLLVTFNYDKMIEGALPSVGVKIEELSHYIGHAAFKLFKLHGSVDWAREVETVIPNLRERNAWEVVRELIQGVGELRLSDRYRMVGGQPISKVDDTPLFPAIAIPVETKPGFECPSDHLECLRAHLSNITKILVVGWRATEKHFLDLVSSAVTREVPMQVVAGQKPYAQDVLNRISAAGINVLGEAVDGGVSEYVVSR